MPSCPTLWGRCLSGFGKIGCLWRRDRKRPGEGGVHVYGHIRPRRTARKHLAPPEVFTRALDGPKTNTALPRHLVETTLSTRPADVEGHESPAYEAPPPREAVRLRHSGTSH